MAKPMNAFAAVLLAFPFYLAIKGRLVMYIDLAKPGHSPAGASGTASTPTPSTGNTAQAPSTPAASSTNAQAQNVEKTAATIANFSELVNAFGDAGIFG